jgi:hypothetical protein
MSGPGLLLERADASAASTLLRCVREPHDPRLPDHVGRLVAAGKLSTFLGLADFHRVLGSVAPAVHGASGVPDDDLVTLDGLLAQQLARHLRTLEDLRRASDALDGIPWFLIKGPAVAETAYPNPELRAYGDLDLVVPAARFEEAIDALEAGGSTIEDQNWELLRKELRSQLHLRLPSGTLGDVHWHLVNRGAVRSAFRIPMDELFTRATRATIAGLETPVLEPTDALLHLALHASLSGANKLIWLQDVTMVLRAENPDLDEVVRRARRWGIGAPVAATLERAVALGAPVDARVIGALYRSRSIGAISAALARRWPPERSIGQDPAALWAQLVRESWPATMSATVRRVQRAFTERHSPPGGHASLRSAGSPRDRAAFFAAASGAGRA